MANTYLEDIDFSAPASDTSCGGHIAYTFGFQGGAASGFNTPLMFKGNEQAEVTFDKIDKLKDLGEDVTDLHKSYVSQLMNSLQDAVSDKYSDGWDWISVVDADFDAGTVIICTDYGLFSTSFEVNGLVVTVGDTAEPVMAMTDYQVVEGDILISIDYFDNLIDQAISSMVKGAIKHQHVKDLLVKAKNGVPANDSVNAETSADDSANTNTIDNGEFQLDNTQKEDFLKSTEFQDLMKAQIAEAVEKATAEAKAAAEADAQEAIAKANAELEELRKAEAARIEDDYSTVIKSFGFVEEEKVELLVKHLVENAEVADAIVEAFTKAAAAVEVVKSEFAVEKGASVINSSPVIKSSRDLMAQRAKEINARKNK